ncbi:MAG TPA: PepSY domain-containing protein [Gemmatimonadales bacterium]|nr:PepSY domain-containing protein [Gemmatimonadales bacterium]
MRSLAPLALAVVLMAGVAGVAAAQQTPPADPMHSQGTYKRTVPDSLLSQAKVSEDSARALALTRVPNGMVQALVLERQRGKLVWSFAIRDPAKSGNTEVVVNAMDGSILKPSQKSSS